MANISRRSVLKNASLAALAAVGSTAACATAVEPKQWDKTCEVLIIGAGAAGLFASISAKESGAKSVVVIDKNVTPFLNATCYSAGYVTASGTKVQAKEGIDDKDGKPELVKEIMKTGANLGNQDLVELFVAHGAEALDWLTDHGVELHTIENPSYRVRRMYSNSKASGSAYSAVLYPAAQKLGATFEFKTRACELVTTPDGNKVIGVVVEKDGKRSAYKAEKGVLIATGGFASSGEMIDDYLLTFRGAVSAAAPSSVGEGIRMAGKIGAATTHMDFAAVYAYGVPTDVEKRRGIILRAHRMNLHGPIIVGQNGKRFIKDEASPTAVSNAMAQMRLRNVYIIATRPQIDAWLKEDPLQFFGATRDQFLKELDEQKLFARRADTIEELAGKLGVDPKGLTETIRRYQGFVKAGEDADFHREFMNGDFSKGPFYGFICTPIVLVTIGGLKVNKRLQVLDMYGKPIEGLYAAGEVLGAIHGNSYTSGNSLGAALTFGKQAGKYMMGK